MKSQPQVVTQSFAYCRGELGHLSRHCDADAVGNAELRRLRFHHLFGNVDDTLHGHLAFVRTAEGGGNHDVRDLSFMLSATANVEPRADRFSRRHALVAFVIGIGRDDHHADLVHLRFQRPLEPPLIH